MSQTDPAPTDPREQNTRGVLDEETEQSMKALEQLGERFTPWLIEVGSWIFGGLIAFNLLVMGSLMTVGPVDRAIVVSTAAFALALPLNVTGLVLLRLVQDLKQVRFEDEVAHAFEQAGLTLGEEQIPSAEALETMSKSRPRVVLSTSSAILTLSVVLTVTGMTAALWHMAWWIGITFLAMVLIGLVIVTVAFGSSPRPRSATEKAQWRRRRAEIIAQAKERSRQAKGQG